MNKIVKYFPGRVDKIFADIDDLYQIDTPY